MTPAFRRAARHFNHTQGETMIQQFCLSVGAAAAIALAGASPAQAHGNKYKAEFERIGTFIVCENTSCDRNSVEETVAEITTVSKDGRTLIYTDSPQNVIGFVDIANPSKPKALGVVHVGGEPTSVATVGKYAIVGVNTSDDFISPSGHLAVFDVAACLASIGGCTPVAKLDMEGQPDSVAVSPDQRYAAVAVENERDEDVTVDGVEGGLPQLPAGHLAVVDIKGKPQDWKVRIVELTGLTGYAPEDPEPEYVAINRFNIAAVTLQENNRIVLVHLPSGKVVRHFGAGAVTLQNIDTKDNSVIEFNGSLNGVAREPDSIAWLDEQRMVTANEGDLFGGSRGFSIFDATGRVRFDAGNSFEYLAAKHGHYPESRADAKGAEPEGLTVGRYGRDQFIFVGSERANFVAVYEDRGGKPEFVQLLPTGIAPEGLLAIPERNLFVASTEDDEDWRAQINIFALKRGEASYPQVISGEQRHGPLAGRAPIAWGALSALAPSPRDEDVLYAVPDSYYEQSRIFRMDVSRTPAVIFDEIVLKKDGATVNYDLEGIATRRDGGFWLASEGNGTAAKPNLLVQAAGDGVILREVRLPAEVDALQTSNGFEGVAATGGGTSEKVYVAFQRGWKNDPAGRVRIGEYTPASDAWRFFYYPLDAVESPAGGWVGLSELVALGNGRFATIERDNQGGPNARIKKVFVFSIAGLTPQPQGGVFPLVTKYEKLDLLPELQSYNGWVLDKVEGLTVAADGKVYALTDNDGVDGASGETRLLRLGRTLH
jgi:hypothetical protein